MKRFKNVLVAATPGHIDPSVLARAGELATANDARLTVIDVVEPLPTWRRLVGVDAIGSAAIDARHEAIRHAALIAGVPDVEVVVTTGKAFIEIIRHVLRDPCDLVVVGEDAPAKGVAGVSAGVMQLLRKCPTPVWVMRPARPGRMRILALVDPDPGDPVRAGLNDLVLTLATSMARRQGANLAVGHAWDLPGEAALGSGSYLMLPGAEFHVMRQSAEDEHRAQLEALVAGHKLREIDGEVHLVKGDPGDVLPGLAAQLDTTLIVMGTVARTGLSGLMMGNTAETILRSVNCSVLAVKPDGFVSPVQLDREQKKESG